MAEPTVGECPWRIMHTDKDEEHVAWFQTALLAGDFAPGRRPISNYVVQIDGEICDPGVPPRCGTCNKVPKVEDLTPVDRGNETRIALMPYRLGLVAWPTPTNDATCYHCNDSRQGELEEVSVDTLSRAVVRKVRRGAKRVKVCRRCARFLEKSAESVLDVLEARRS